MLECHLKSMPVFARQVGDVRARASEGVVWNETRGDGRRRESVFSCVDCGREKQTLVCSVYSETTAWKQADQNILGSTLNICAGDTDCVFI